MSEIPTMAVHMVYVYENTSVLPDEFVSHRIGLLPIMSSCVDRFKYDWDCECSSGDSSNECLNCK